uniref:Glyoxylate reductase/hydroxypyruvate reductase n=1 Tax=Panagrellus redivivus TaxID=6233 RepID=A0A7E4UN45_PANRE
MTISFRFLLSSRGLPRWGIPGTSALSNRSLILNTMSNKQFKVVITEKEPPYNKIKEIAEVYQNPNGGSLARDILLEQSKDADAILCLLRDKIDKELLDNAPKLKVVSTLSVGYEHIDLDECRKRGIRVGNTPDVLTATTAELGATLTLTAARRIVEAADTARNGGWNIWTPYWLCGRGINGATVGIYGLGRIGEGVAKRLKGFEPKRIIYTNRKPKENSEYEFVQLDELLKQSDFLIVTVNAATIEQQFFNLEKFKKMKPTAVFVNISRGCVVNQDDLYTALKEGIIGAAGLDVTVPEPLPTDNPLFSLKNCVILPHIGSATMETRDAMVNLSEDNLINGLTGKPIIGPLE